MPISKHSPVHLWPAPVNIRWSCTRYYCDFQWCGFRHRFNTHAYVVLGIWPVAVGVTTFTDAIVMTPLRPVAAISVAAGSGNHRGTALRGSERLWEALNCTFRLVAVCGFRMGGWARLLPATMKAVWVQLRLAELLLKISMLIWESLSNCFQRKTM